LSANTRGSVVREGGVVLRVAIYATTICTHECGV
jgi:hypothetical protein